MNPRPSNASAEPLSPSMSLTEWIPEMIAQGRFGTDLRGLSATR